MMVCLVMGCTGGCGYQVLVGSAQRPLRLFLQLPAQRPLLLLLLLLLPLQLPLLVKWPLPLQ
ncbi:hypothetical protein [Noviherbaspirillum suwonense]|uniref:hypothetical protein n=1 Tax=Noviherbaspirillum suwonense TaxID=1224511 RepID=UPI0024B8704C|nr:hypothetical protein [Noviherbaspirillum suwonense]